MQSKKLNDGTDDDISNLNTSFKYVKHAATIQQTHHNPELFVNHKRSIIVNYIRMKTQRHRLKSEYFQQQAFKRINSTGGPVKSPTRKKLSTTQSSTDTAKFSLERVRNVTAKYNPNSRVKAHFT